MTKEDAIYEIKQLAVLSNEKDIGRITKALEMAIEALHTDIVRCKECKWASPNKEGDYDCKCHIPIFRVDAEGYCYLAERKEGE